MKMPMNNCAILGPGMVMGMINWTSTLMGIVVAHNPQQKKLELCIK